MRALGSTRSMSDMSEAEFMNYIVELIIRAIPDRIINFFEQMPKGQRVSMFRRLAKYVHPDKNAHRSAKEAF